MKLYIFLDKLEKKKTTRNAKSIKRVLDRMDIGLGQKCFNCEYYSPECVRRAVDEGLRVWDDSDGLEAHTEGEQICWCCAKYCSCSISRGEAPKGTKWHWSIKSSTGLKAIHIDKYPHFKRG